MQCDLDSTSSCEACHERWHGLVVSLFSHHTRDGMTWFSMIGPYRLDIVDMD